jgi:hypothetical protein
MPIRSLYFDKIRGEFFYDVLPVHKSLFILENAPAQTPPDSVTQNL